mmetsp:Transcript_99692/g.281445  ORF Transcript_99692/g.281445 Transcript_99692/m.281445 type:complete len:691 (+) Transcript_99692:108-2180(+)
MTTQDWFQQLQFATSHRRQLSRLLDAYDAQLAELRCAFERAGSDQNVKEGAEEGRIAAPCGDAHHACSAPPTKSVSGKVDNEEESHIAAMPSERGTAGTGSPDTVGRREGVNAHDRELSTEPTISFEMAPMVLQTVWASDETYVEKRNPDHTASLVPVRIGTSVDSVKKSNSFVQAFVMDPRSVKYFSWQLVSAFVLAHDVAALPLFAAFPIGVTLYWELLILTTAIFWTIDLGLNFFVGRFKHGILDMRPSSIARHYVSSWFLFDLLIVLVDWFLMMYEGALSPVTGALRLSKPSRVIRIAKLARMWRMIRLAKCVTLSQVLFAPLNNEFLVIAVGMCQMLFGMAFLVHLVSCCWYAWVQVWKGTFANSWLDSFQDEDLSVGYIYALCFHWVMCQFTPGPTPFYPANIPELTFAIVLLFFGLMIFSSFLAHVSSRFTFIRQSAMKALNQDVLIRQFLVEHGISRSLGQSIKAFTKWTGRKRSRVLMESIPIFQDKLPQKLRMHLWYEVFAPPLTLHPLFYQIESRHHSLFVEICFRATKEMSYGAKSDMFLYGARATGMHFILDGSLAYYAGNQDNLGKGKVVNPKEWLCEVALWTNWHHTGSCLVESHCVSAEISAAMFGEIASCNRSALTQLRKYARLWVQSAPDDASSGDLCCRDFDGLEDFAVTTMPSNREVNEEIRPKQRPIRA